ncbi:MAG: hypothetical protein J6V07_01105 [Clostridia bacterium]|nr:hypothetical protein [Clostridia bacterium]
MQDFWEFSVWSGIALIGTLLISLIFANILKKRVPLLRNSLIPTSVLGGLMLLVISVSYEAIFGVSFFNTTYFGGNGAAGLEVITYHALALGFIATAFKPSHGKHGLKRNGEILDSGLTTVATYLLQATLGLGITIIAALLMTDFFPASGILLPFGYGQGTGQALNYGSIYESDYGFVGGRSFGLTIAALGFLSAAFGGVIHLNILKRRGLAVIHEDDAVHTLYAEDVQSADEIPMNGSMDKLSVQFGFVFGSYMLVHALLLILGSLLPSMRSVLFGFNFLFGVLAATGLRLFFGFLRRRGVVKKQYVNGFLMDRISGFCFDLMVVAGIAAIRIEVLAGYWPVILILGVVGAVTTYFYNRSVARRLFPEYPEHQFLAMYGMLTGTASTGIILLREIDPSYKTPAADNMVYQTLPAIIFGFPMMLLATVAPTDPEGTLLAVAILFILINILLFRRQIFRRRRRK